MRPDLSPEPPATVPVECEITCERCGHTIVEFNRQLTQDEIDRGMDTLIAALRRRIDELEGEGHDIGTPRGRGVLPEG